MQNSHKIANFISQIDKKNKNLIPSWKYRKYTGKKDFVCEMSVLEKYETSRQVKCALDVGRYLKIALNREHLKY